MAAPHVPYGAADAAAPGPRRALILAGGGMRVAYQAGVIRALFDEGMTFTHADGTSGGTINLAMLMSGLSPAEMCTRWRTLDVKRFSSLLSLEEYFKPHALMGLGDADGITGHVFPHLGIDVERINAATGMAGTFNLCNYTRKTIESVPNDRVDLELLIAGISLPIFMAPLVRGDTTYTDAVWIKDANLMEAVRRGADELWLVWCIGNTPEYRPGSFNQYVHMIELSANGGLFEELDRIAEINDRIRAGEPVGGRTKPIRLHVLRPERALPLDPEVYVGRITADTLHAMGYADARSYLDPRDDEGLPLTPEVTRMAASAPGISFTETMKGGFALGVTDPREGEKKGKAAGTELAMHATVSVHDIDRFIADPDHRGGIIGSIDFTPFGRGMPTGAGRFNLFCPAEEPNLKLMVYELPFRHDGKDYYMAGRKEVRDDPGFDMWKDLTTLLTVLHEGTDTSGPIVGAGTLSLSVADFTKVMASIRAIDTESVGDQARVLGKFGKFFAGEVWDNYAGLARRG
jgi:predicted acylesterase/phospholipase RssA